MPTIEERTAQDGTISYRVKVRLRGQPPQYATFARLTDARRWAAKTETEIRDGRYFPANAAKSHTLKQLIERYEKEILPRKKPGAQRAQRYQLAWWKEQLGPYTLDKITPALIAEYRDKLLHDTKPIGKNRPETAPEGEPGAECERRYKPAGIRSQEVKRSPATVARILSGLSHVFTIAMKEWQWVEDNPFRKVSKPKEPRGIVRFLDDGERQRLLEECKKSESKDLYIAVVLALSTGMRKGELMTLRWRQVDLPRGMITLEDTKNDERRSVPLVGHALALMTERSKVRHIDTDLVFPGAPSFKRGEAKRVEQPIDLTKPWHTALRKAKIETFRWHDLRHSCASYLAMNGATLAEIAEVLGHKTLSMVKRYAHLSEAHTSKVVTAMNEKIFAEGGKARATKKRK
jgi:integrase